jgi:hypothetical protein
MCPEPLAISIVELVLKSHGYAVVTEGPVSQRSSGCSRAWAHQAQQASQQGLLLKPLGRMREQHRSINVAHHNSFTSL